MVDIRQWRGLGDIVCSCFHGRRLLSGDFSIQSYESSPPIIATWNGYVQLKAYSQNDRICWWTFSSSFGLNTQLSMWLDLDEPQGYVDSVTGLFRAFANIVDTTSGTDCVEMVIIGILWFDIFIWFVILMTGRYANLFRRTLVGLSRKTSKPINCAR